MNQETRLPWLNYHHLLYFWTVAREGGVSRAAAKLSLAQPTVSAQVRMLEEALGEQLFQRQGRRLVLTEVGRVVLRYADDIFGIGRELVETLRGRPAGRPMQLVVGVANAVPKLVVYRLLRPALIGPDRVHLVCREERTEQLLAQLATHALDVVIADAPAPPHIRVKVFSHLLGESDMGFYAPKALATRIRRRFPASLHEVPMLLPTSTTPLRRELDTWFDRQGVRPLIVGEFDDTALMKAFGRGAGAVFPAPAAIGAEVGKLYGVTSCGRTHDVRERYYVISAERRLTHPTVLALTSAAREGIFG